MIVELFMDVVIGLVRFILAMMPNGCSCSFLTDVSGNVAVVVDHMAPIGVWLPFSAAATAVQVVVCAFAFAFVMKLIRFLLSLFTGGGGSSA